MTFVSRIGCFFALVGIILLVIFLASDFSHNPDFNYLLVGGLGLILGYVFYRRGKPPAPPSPYFSALRKANQQLQSRKKKSGFKK